MTDKISSKLLAVLVMAVLVAGAGAWRLVSGSDEPTESGFDQTDELPAVVVAPDEPSPIIGVEPDTAEPRNPFARSDAPDDTTPDAASDGDANTAAETESTVDSGDAAADPAPAATEPETQEAPTFPNPDLVDQEDQAGDLGRGDPRDDTSFEG